jgi:Peptidase propeptide and YPEB domain
MFAFAGLLLLASTAGAPVRGVAPPPVPQDTLTVKEAEPGLKSQARIASDSAMKIALARVPGGTIKEAEVEKEHGRVVYSFDIVEPKKSGVEEVLVDAKSGKVVSATHESAAAEAKERATEVQSRVKHDTTNVKRDSAR